MRRWNGWGDDAVDEHVPDGALTLLRELVGPSTRPVDVTFDDVVGTVPASRLGPDAGVAFDLDPPERVRHARGQSLPDWIALRSGRLGAVPDAVARPGDTAAVAGLLQTAAQRRLILVPYGGGSSVVGGVTVEPSDRPVVTVDLGTMSGLVRLDERSGLATFGAGTLGPAVEAALRPHGRNLGHFPQSFEWSSIGGWVATRSVGQQAHGFGRIDELYAGGRLETPRGPLDLPPHPASAAGPDVRQVVLGSEGRLGILTEVTVRTHLTPRLERFSAYVVPDWERALELARRIGQSGLPISMARVSTPLETATTFALAGDRRGSGLLRRYLGWRGQGPERCLVIVGLAGDPAIVGATASAVDDLVRGSHGVAAPAVGPAWKRSRFSAPYLRNALWDLGYAVDTLETATDWSTLAALAADLARSLRHGLDDEGERVHAFSHLSHPYATGSSLYTSYLFRLSADPDQTLERWRRLKTAASETIVRHGATISHQHGVGRDHAPYLAAEKGPFGMRAIEALIHEFDPDGVMHRGILVEDAAR